MDEKTQTRTYNTAVHKGTRDSLKQTNQKKKNEGAFPLIAKTRGEEQEGRRGAPLNIRGKGEIASQGA